MSNLLKNPPIHGNLFIYILNEFMIQSVFEVRINPIILKQRMSTLTAKSKLFSSGLETLFQIHNLCAATTFDANVVGK